MSDLAFASEDRASPSVQTPAPKRRRKPEPQPELPSRKTLDLRLAANKQFNQIVARITAEVGGDVSTVQRHLIEAFAGTAVIADAINVRTLLGQPIDDDLIEALAASSTAASTLISLSQRIASSKQHSVEVG
jgi:hypothetical protein